jgi:hypothetical protein
MICLTDSKTFDGNEEDKGSGSSEMLIMIYHTAWHIPQVSNLNS